jgi:hypothetical protein
MSRRGTPEFSRFPPSTLGTTGGFEMAQMLIVASFLACACAVLAVAMGAD